MDDGHGAAGLPHPATPLIGRDRETAAARELLGVARLVTLVGTGGAGKTRLSLEVARGAAGGWSYPPRASSVGPSIPGSSYPPRASSVGPSIPGSSYPPRASSVGPSTPGSADGAFFVDLAPLRDPGQVLPAIARTLGLRDSGSRPLADTLHRYLRDRHILLLLDNVEHLLGAAREVADLLALCPAVRVLATSRAPLQVPGEHLLPVAPLPVPDPHDLPAPAELIGNPSVALLVARIVALDPGFVLEEANHRTVAEICHALDGLPLALELAAVQVRAFGLDEVLAGTRDRFALLHLPRRAVSPRHRSLAATLRWSVDLLPEPTRRTFARLAIFTGGWTPEAARAVCGPDVLPTLAELVDLSLVVATAAEAGVRYRMLETVREYASGLLDELGERDELRRRHFAWCRDLAGAATSGWLAGAEVESVRRVAAELDNIRAALDGCAPSETADALQAAADLLILWDQGGHLGEGRGHLERLLARPESHADPRSRAAGLDVLGIHLIWQDEHAAARAALHESIALSERLGDGDRVAWSTSTVLISRFLVGEIGPVEPLADEALATARRVGTPGTLSRATSALGLVRMAQGRPHESAALFRECIEIFDVMGVSWGRGRQTFFLGWAAHLAGDVVAARALCTESAEILLRIGDRRSLPDSLDLLACLATAAGEHPRALRLFATVLRLRATSGSRRQRYLRPHCEPAEQATRSALGPAAAARVVADIDALPLARAAAVALAPDPPPHGVTPRELEVARLVAAGLTNRQIGRTLAISERTAERHVENLRAKLGVGTRAQVAAWTAAVPRPTV